MCRINAHCVVRKNGCVLMSDAPARAPRRRFSSLMSSLRISDLHRLLSISLRPCRSRQTGDMTYFDICGDPECSGNGTSSLKIFAKVALRFLPLKGVVPYNISYTNMPRVHQSTALVWPQPLITSGAIYSSVPTNEFVRKLFMHDLVSTWPGEFALPPFRPRIIVGFPPGSDCLERSKSDNIMWPDW